MLLQSQRNVAARCSSQRRTAAIPSARSSVKACRGVKIAGSRRAQVIHNAATTSASGTASAVAVGTIALRKAVAQAAYKGTNVFVTGSQGQLAIRIVRELLAAGFKVTAGVTDLDQAQATFNFFKRYELIDKAAAANLKLTEVDVENPAFIKVVPKRSKVIVVDGDVEGKAKSGAKEVAAALALAEATSAAQVILVSTQPGAAPSGGGGGFFGGLFGGGAKPAPAGKPLDKLSKVEQQVADSGKPYAIIRAYGTDRTEDGDEPGPYLAIGNQGTIPTNQVSSKAQVASVVAEVLKAAGSTNELVIEVGATQEEQLSPADTIGELVSAAEAAAAEAAAAAAEEAAKGAAPSLGLFGLGTKSIIRKAEAEAASKAAEPEPEAEAPKPKAGTGFFGFGTGKVSVKKAEVEEEEAKPAVGTVSARRAAAARAAKKAPEPEPEEEPKKKAGSGFFGFGTGKVTAKKAPEPEPEEEEQPKKKAGSGFFSFGGTAKVKAAKEEPKKEEPKPVKRAVSPRRAPEPEPPVRGRSAGTGTTSRTTGTTSSRSGTTTTSSSRSGTSATGRSSPSGTGTTSRAAAGTTSSRSGTSRTAAPAPPPARGRSASPAPAPARGRSAAPAPPPARGRSASPAPSSSSSRSSSGTQQRKAGSSSSSSSSKPPAKKANDGYVYIG